MKDFNESNKFKPNPKLKSRHGENISQFRTFGSIYPFLVADLDKQDYLVALGKVLTKSTLLSDIVELTSYYKSSFGKFRAGRCKMSS